MQMKNVQMSLLDTYNDVCKTMENNKPILPVHFYTFYRSEFRNRLFY